MITFQSQGALHADLALRSCSHLSDSYLTLPSSGDRDKVKIPVSPKLDQDNQHDYLSKLLGNANLDLQVRSQKSRDRLTSDAGPGIGLEAMAAAASIRVMSEFDKKDPSYNSLAVLIDAASCR